MQKRVGRFVIVYVLALLVLAGIPLQASVLQDDLRVGPFVDKIVYNVIVGNDEQVQSLIDDEIDLIGETVHPNYLEELQAAENIRVANRLRNGYDFISINCNRYPLNITSFRRALAFALNKTGICDDIWNGLAVPQDCPIPQTNLFSAEGLLDYTYYEANVALGNQLLDAAGFFDIDEDGFREAPDGSKFDVLIQASSQNEAHIEIGNFVLNALEALSVEVEILPTEYMEYWLNWEKGNYEIIVIGEDFANYDVEWFAYEYWSKYAYEPYWNTPLWQNSTFDSWREQLLYDSEFDNVFQAVIEMQKIWVYECPAIICSQNVALSAYRTDRFEGFINSVQSGVPSWWTNYKVKHKEELGGPAGGVLRWSNGRDMDTFNFMASSSSYSENVLQMLYDSLLKQGADGNDILWLAESYTVETNDDNPSVSNGQTRFTFDIRQNVTWSDGMPLTGEDVAFSLNYYQDAWGYPEGQKIANMTVAYARSLYKVIVEFSNESYWHLHNFGYRWVIPRHIFQEIGLDGWHDWNPNPPNEAMITSGPFNVSEYVQGEFLELTYNPTYVFGYYIGAHSSEPTTPTALSPVLPTTNIPNIPISISTLDLVITIPSLIVITVVFCKWYRERETMFIQR